MVPSALLFFKKIEGKRQYFEQLLRAVVDLCKTHPEEKSNLLKSLYRFIFNGLSPAFHTISP